jgi:RimJ/RimL family protein N-acetyltransferase
VEPGLQRPKDAARLLDAQPATELPAEGQWVQLAVRDAATKRLLGAVALHTMEDQPDTYEIGITLAPTSQGGGIATEAVARVIDYLIRDAARTG